MLSRTDDVTLKAFSPLQARLCSLSEEAHFNLHPLDSKLLGSFHKVLTQAPSMNTSRSVVHSCAQMTFFGNRTATPRMAPLQPIHGATSASCTMRSCLWICFRTDTFQL
jgi:hypothetical protein